ncbi:MAG: DUF4416 family protein, partial [Pirellulales bacterium]|nr:DUF4416 family protein [Pirellulales bacterium]
MAEIRAVEPVVRFCAVITRYDQARKWAIECLVRHWGPVSKVTEPIRFEAGGFYTASMGAGLQKVLVAFEHFADPSELADWKHSTNQWEADYAARADHPHPRPLNLDPGYLTQAKLVLATTKDRDHRIYLRDGMFAEVTLTYVGKQWRDHRWTYPSYRFDEVADFANAGRRICAHQEYSIAT